MTKSFLVDANVFIQAKNLHYKFEFCEAFWDWIHEGHKANLIFSIKKVKAELLAGKKDDPVREWASELPETFFLDDTNDHEVMSSYAAVISTINAETKYRQDAKKAFAEISNADAFLIAAAHRKGFTIITQEKPDSNAIRRVLIPNAAAKMGVTTLTIFELLSKHAASTFKFKK